MSKTVLRINNRLELSMLGGRFNISVFAVIAFFVLIITDPSIYTLIVFLCIFAHELSHISVAKLLGGKIQRINVYPFGIDIISDTGLLSYEKELAVALAGSFANIASATLAEVIFGTSHSAPVCFFICSSMILGIGNLIPIPVFDGGRAVHIIIRRFMLPNTAFYVEKWVDRLAFLLFFAFSLCLCFYSDCNLSVVVTISYAAICAVLLEKLTSDRA